MRSSTAANDAAAKNTSKRNPKSQSIVKRSFAFRFDDTPFAHKLD